MVESHVNSQYVGAVEVEIDIDSFCSIASAYSDSENFGRDEFAHSESARHSWILILPDTDAPYLELGEYATELSQFWWPCETCKKSQLFMFQIPTVLSHDVDTS